MFYLIIRHFHSGLRWLVLLLLVISIINALKKWLSKSDYTKADNILSVLTVESIHIQFLIGLVLYFISPKVIFDTESMKNALLRFFLVEHSLLMLVAVGIVSVGFKGVKKAISSNIKFKKIFIFFTIALIIILLAIPWPWRNLGSNWI